MPIVFNPKLCIGCHACTVACQMEKKTPPTVHFCSVRQNPDSLFMEYKACEHCPDADCVKACSLGAIVREKGTVRVLAEKCKSCGQCAQACPQMHTCPSEIHYSTQNRFRQTLPKITHGAESTEVRPLQPTSWEADEHRLPHQQHHAGKAMKCDLCWHRMVAAFDSKAYRPACVEACHMKALSFCPADFAAS